jgi:hypothetical protein
MTRAEAYRAWEEAVAARKGALEVVAAAKAVLERKRDEEEAAYRAYREIADAEIAASPAAAVTATTNQPGATQ